VEWSSRAACLSAEPEQFFPVGGAAAADRESAAAKQVCARCDVLAQCREYALATRQPFGVWGGLDEEERRAIVGDRVVSAAR
jgi:WhiB family redox-sensing transcriptional regulator